MGFLALGWAFVAAFNPTLLAAVTAMLILPNPRRLLFGYLCGAALTSTTIGLLIVFELKGSQSAVSTGQHTIAPIVDFAIGGLLLVIAFVIGTGRDHRRRARRERKRAARAGQPPPRWQRALSKGSARMTFVVGALLTLPGAAFLAGMNDIAKSGAAKGETVVAVVAFNAIMLLLLEVPLLGALVAPEWTDRAVLRFSTFIRANAGRIVLWIAAVLGALLVLRGFVEAF